LGGERKVGHEIEEEEDLGVEEWKGGYDHDGSKNMLDMI